ncbi:MAG: ABC transporter permease [Gemmatimonadetes bacterium]|nr:ABC transporter permease [Gemmatimonadota bacterium]MBL0178483.1 ABC transporter permease [Gemmatimonadota bacterium]
MRRRLLGALHRVPALEATAALLPAAGWMLLWFGVPIAIMATYAFRPRHLLGGVYPGWTTSSVARLLDPLYLTILSKSLLIAAVATLLTLLLAYPIALVIARATRWRSLLLLLVVLPFWTSFLVRTYATVFLLRDTGPLNQLLMALGIVTEPIPLLYTTGAVLFGLVTCSIPFAVLPIYASLEKLDPVLLEAAEALGATEWRRFVRVTWPLTLPGVIAGALLVFIPTLGSFLTSDLLGGAKVVLIGNLIQNQFTSGRNWPFGSALAFLLMAVVLVGMLVRLRWARDESLA